MIASSKSALAAFSQQMIQGRPPAVLETRFQLCGWHPMRLGCPLQWHLRERLHRLMSTADDDGHSLTLWIGLRRRAARVEHQLTCLEHEARQWQRTWLALVPATEGGSEA